MPQSFNQATKKSQYQAKVQSMSSLGSNKSDFDTNIKQGVEAAIGDFIQRVKDNIDKADLPVTGAISDIRVKSDGNEISIVANKHLVFVSRGVNGTKESRYNTPHKYTDKMPPVYVFEDWIRRRNLNLRDEEQFGKKGQPFKELTDEQKIRKAAWGMAKHRFYYGVAPKDIYEKEIPKLVEDVKIYVKEFAIPYIRQNIDIDPKLGGGKRIIT